MKFVEKNEKVFTKDLRKDIMNRKNNPLNKDKSFYERKGLIMNITKNSILVELKDKKVDEKVLKCYYNICKYYKVKMKI